MKAALVALVIVTGAALDLATKAWARASLEPYGPASDFLPFVSLRLTFNEGVSFSLFAFEGDIGVVCGRGRNPTLRFRPSVFAGEIDVLPAERRDMGQEIGR